MDPFSAAAGFVATGAQLIGSAGSSNTALRFTQRENELARNFAREQTGVNINENSRNRDFQERMSSTAYQRATDDMRAAGINPMYAYSKGGASTPSGGAANAEGASTSSHADVKDPRLGDVINASISSARDADRLKNETAEAKSRITANEAVAVKALAEAGMTSAKTPKEKAIGDTITKITEKINPAKAVEEVSNIPSLLKEAGGEARRKIIEALTPFKAMHRRSMVPGAKK